MVVDDDPSIRTVLRLVLEATDQHRVVAEAAGGEEAIRLTDDLEPDVIVLDSEMPGLSGTATAEIIHRAHPDAALIMFSGSLSHGLEADARRAGIGECIPKPDIDRLEEAVARRC